MATKKKAPTKKPSKKNAADTCPEEVVILINGDPNQQDVYLDAKGNKHHPSVFWQAFNTAAQYQITPDTPTPFREGNGPFPTDPMTGRTDTLTAIAKNGTYGYSIQVLTSKGRNKQVSTGGIIIDG